MTRLYRLGLLIVLFSCNYEPDQEFFKVVEPPDPTGFTIDLSEKNDTIYVFNNTTLTFKAETGQRAIYSASVYFDDKLITTFDTNETVFQLSANGFEDGTYPLRIEMFTASGSGSLADRLGAEQFKITRQWIAYVDRSLPNPVLFKTVSAHEGTLRVTWQRYKQYNFQSYLISKYWKNPYTNGYVQIWTREVKDQNITWLDDDTYMGGGVKYEIQVVTGDHESGKNEIEFHSVYDPSVKYTWADRTRIKLMWRKAPFAANFTKYEIRVGPQTFTKDSPADTTAIVEPGVLFGQAKQVYLYVYPHSDVYNLLGVSVANVTLGKPIPKMSMVTYNQSLGKYFALFEDPSNTTRLIRLNGETMEVEQESSFPVYKYSISDNGQHLYVGWSGSLKKIDPVTFTETASFNYSINSLAVSNNNLVTIWTDNGTSVVRMPDNTVIATYGHAFSVMSKSKFLLYGGKLYEWNGETLVLKTTYDQTNLSSGLFVDDDKLILVYSDRFQVVDIVTNSTINTIWRGDYAHAYAQPPVYDPVSERVGFFSVKPNRDTGTYYLYALDNPVPTQSFELAAPSYPLNVYTIINNTLICSTGFQLPLSDF